MDVNKIEEFLEERLVPPRYFLYRFTYHFLLTCLRGLLHYLKLIYFFRYPKLAAKHPESNTAGIDVFAKFSAYIKNPRKEANEGEFNWFLVKDILGCEMRLFFCNSVLIWCLYVFRSGESSSEVPEEVG